MAIYDGDELIEISIEAAASGADYVLPPLKRMSRPKLQKIRVAANMVPSLDKDNAESITDSPTRKRKHEQTTVQPKKATRGKRQPTDYTSSDWAKFGQSDSGDDSEEQSEDDEEGGEGSANKRDVNGDDEDDAHRHVQIRRKNLPNRQNRRNHQRPTPSPNPTSISKDKDKTKGKNRGKTKVTSQPRKKAASSHDKSDTDPDDEIENESEDESEDG